MSSDWARKNSQSAGPYAGGGIPGGKKSSIKGRFPTRAPLGAGGGEKQSAGPMVEAKRAGKSPEGLSSVDLGKVVRQPDGRNGGRDVLQDLGLPGKVNGKGKVSPAETSPIDGRRTWFTVVRAVGQVRGNKLETSGRGVKHQEEKRPKPLTATVKRDLCDNFKQACMGGILTTNERWGTYKKGGEGGETCSGGTSQ